VTRDEAILDLVTDAAMHGLDRIDFDLSRNVLRRHMRAGMYTVLQGITQHEELSYTGPTTGAYAFQYRRPEVL
jgi:hypothetical protein